MELGEAEPLASGQAFGPSMCTIRCGDWHPAKPEHDQHRRLSARQIDRRWPEKLSSDALAGLRQRYMRLVWNTALSRPKVLQTQPGCGRASPTQTRYKRRYPGCAK